MRMQPDEPICDILTADLADVKYYNMIGELPDNDRSVPFRRVTGGAGERDEERIMQGHKDAVSRHRDIVSRALRSVRLRKLTKRLAI